MTWNSEEHKNKKEVWWEKLFWPAKSVEGGTVWFGDIIEEQLQLEGMRGCFPRETETYTHTQ